MLLRFPNTLNSLPSNQMLPTISTPVISPHLLPKFHTHLWNNPNLKSISAPLRSLQLSCSSSSRDGEQDMLTTELHHEIKKLNSQAEEAFNKSREILFTELSNFVGLSSEDLRRKWRRMSDEERWGLARGFVAEWSAHLHPLSARSVKELVDQHLGQGNNNSIDGFSDSGLFPGLRKFLGFPVAGNNQDSL